MGETVEQIPDHPAFAGVAGTVASLYDFALDPDNGMVFDCPETGASANKVYLIPRSREDLLERHAAIQRWARLTHGFLGRSPDHVGGFLAGFAGAAPIFDRNGHAFSRNVQRFYRKVLAEDLFVSYAIVPPQVSRATTAHGWEDDGLVQAGVVAERDDGIVVRGAQMLGTSAALSDYLYVSCIKPLSPEDAVHANSFVVPLSAPGLKLYCRRPFALGIPSAFDYPMSARFDESDALVVFDDVFVPWEDVFAYRDVEGLKTHFFETSAHILGNNQAQIRFVEKLRFLLGISRKIAKVNQIDKIPAVQEKLGELAALATTVEALLIASETNPTMDQFGVVRPDPRFLYAAIAQQSETYPRVIQIMRELVGGGVLQLPSSYRELLADETRKDMERYVRSPDTPARERIQLFKLAWDVIGSEFAGRHQQYEMFYAGAPFIAKGWSYRNYDYDQVAQDVDAFLSSYSVE